MLSLIAASVATLERTRPPHEGPTGPLSEDDRQLLASVCHDPGKREAIENLIAHCGWRYACWLLRDRRLCDWMDAHPGAIADDPAAALRLLPRELRRDLDEIIRLSMADLGELA